MDKVYKAHHRFGNLLIASSDDKFQIKFRLEPGDIFSFNNRRLLHGRTEYDQQPNSGGIIDICRDIIWIEMKL